ncbi:anthranilate synthase component I family protein [Paenibacillus chitinolyticus]|uniref:anthranilate synthase component I family protein n=1 Tax=Paenibacillus chitinolyticus TaxID=79263 RepID=UPI0035DF1D4A
MSATTITLTDLADWTKWAEEGAYTSVPYITSIPWTQDISTWEHAWRAAGTHAFVLESGRGGRYTFLGLHPVAAICGSAASAEAAERDGAVPDGWRSVPMQGAPLETVKRWMAPWRSPDVAGAPKFTGGCVGFWSYDVVRSMEKLPELAEDDLPLPEYSFARYDEVWVFDREEGRLYAAVHTPLPSEPSVSDLSRLYQAAVQRSESMLRLWHRLAGDAEAGAQRLQREAEWQALVSAGEDTTLEAEAAEGASRAFPRESFIRAVERIQAYIGQGDVFQVNLSVRQSRPLQTSPEQIYEALRIVNPSPYMGLMRFPGFALVSGSPELLVQLEGRHLRTRPIAGTRPRGRTPEEDARLADELLSNEKERAEHVMLVDLERNDLGRIARYGSVKVDEFFVIERYSHVMHLVSEVTGELREGLDAFDVIAAAFPGGTITGAPKIRTMEIIEELEPVRRGPYTGSMGWIDYNGNMEFNILIRTLVAVGGSGYIQAGAGIVIDSVPDREYEEALNKARALWKAIQFSEHSMSRAGTEVL